MSFNVSQVFIFFPEPTIAGSVVNIPLASEWTADGPNAPQSATENGELVYLFSAGLGQQLTTFLKVPQSYVANAKIKLYISYYSPSTSGTVLFSSNAYLIRRGIDAVSSTTNLHASTNTAVTNLSVSNQYNQVTMDLSDSSGLINAVTIQPGDMIRINLYRNVSDTDTALVRFISSSTEATAG